MPLSISSNDLQSVDLKITMDLSTTRWMCTSIIQILLLAPAPLSRSIQASAAHSLCSGNLPSITTIAAPLATQASMVVIRIAWISLTRTLVGFARGPYWTRLLIFILMQVGMRHCIPAVDTALMVTLMWLKLLPVIPMVLGLVLMGG
jgi:hypothetical protein